MGLCRVLNPSCTGDEGVYAKAVSDKRQKQSDSLEGTQDGARQSGGLGTSTVECVPAVETFRSGLGHDAAVCKDRTRAIDRAGIGDRNRGEQREDPMCHQPWEGVGPVYGEL